MSPYHSFGMNTGFGDASARKTKHFSSPDSKLLAQRRDQLVNLWDVTTGSVLRTLETTNTNPGIPVFSPDGRRLLWDRQLWDLETGQVVMQDIGGFDGIAAFSPDGCQLAISTGKNIVILDGTPRSSPAPLTGAPQK